MIDNVDIDKVVVSSKVSFAKNGFKYLIGSKIMKNLSDYL